MMFMVDAPDELFDAAPVPPPCTPDGELLGRAEELPPGAWMAATIEGVDIGKLSDWDLPNYLRVAARLQHWAASLVDDAVGELASRPGVGVGAAAEVALALSEPIGAAQRRVAVATRLRRRLPRLRAAFRRGELSERHVREVVEATAVCDDPEILEQVQERVLAHRFGKTAKQLRRYAVRVLDRLDPAAASKRAAKARAEDADVSFEPGDDGMAMSVVHGPVEDVTCVKAFADAYAMRAKQAGDPRRVGALRVEGLARLCGDALTGRGTSVFTTPPTVGGRPVEIGIVVGLRTVLGLDDLPGEIPAAGVIPRDAVAQLVGAERPRVRLMVVDDGDGPTSGRLLYRGVDTWRPTAEQAAHVRAAYPVSVGPGSEVRADRCDIEHTVEWPAGQTIVTNLVPWDRTWHNCKTRGSLRVSLDDDGAVTVTTVLGQSRTVTPYDYLGTRDRTSSADVDDLAPF